MDEVKRFYPSMYPGEMEEHANGGWVRFEDYDALKAAAQRVIREGEECDLDSLGAVLALADLKALLDA
jgi:hypothetical protein